MIVIADTGPINYLILIGEIDVLPALYGRVAVPRSVGEELRRSRTPETVQAWIAQPPSWLEILSPTRSPDEELAQLDAGERDAILLAEELRADQIIIDEIRGRREAERLLLDQGVPLTEVAYRAGHANPHVTARQYAHCLKEDGRAAETYSNYRLKRKQEERHAELVQ